VFAVGRDVSWLDWLLVLMLNLRLRTLF